MRILVQSNAPWAHSGYGFSTRSLLDRLVRTGHEVNVFDFWGLNGGPLQLNIAGQKVGHLPPGEDMWGNAAIAGHVKHTGAEVVITNVDIHVLQTHQDCGAAWLAWTPCDHDPVPPDVVNAARRTTLCLAKTNIGCQDLLRQGVEQARYVTDAVETTQFYPDEALRQVMRKELGLDDEFLIGYVGNNRGWPCRKGQDTAIWAFSRFRKIYPKAKLYMHTNPEAGPDRPPLDAFLTACGLTRDDVIWPDAYLYNTIGYPVAAMRGLYNAFDVLLAPSLGEGGNLPVLEAQSCGTPVIASDWTSHKEVVCREANYLIKVEPFPTVQGSWWGRPAINDVEHGLLWALQNRERLPELGRRSREYMEQHFDWDYVYRSQWTPVLEEVQEGIRNGRYPHLQKDEKREVPA